MLVTWVERDGLARSVLVLLAITTIGSFSYSWGYYEGFYNAKILGQLEKDHITQTAPSTHTPDAAQRKVQHAPTIPAVTMESATTKEANSKSTAASKADEDHARSVRDKVTLPKPKRSARDREGRLERGDRPVHVRSQVVRESTRVSSSKEAAASSKSVSITVQKVSTPSSHTTSTPVHTPAAAHTPTAAHKSNKLAVH